jgi:hypothetical protein
MRPPPPPPPVVALVWSIQKIRNTLCPLRHTYRPYRQFLTAGVIQKRREISGEAELCFCGRAKTNRDKQQLTKSFHNKPRCNVDFARLCTQANGYDLHLFLIDSVWHTEPKHGACLVHPKIRNALSAHCAIPSALPPVSNCWRHGK